MASQRRQRSASSEDMPHQSSRSAAEGGRPESRGRKRAASKGPQSTNKSTVSKATPPVRSAKFTRKPANAVPLIHSKCSPATGTPQARTSQSSAGQSSSHPRGRNTETRHTRRGLQQEDSGREAQRSQSCSRMKGDGHYQTTRQGPTPGGSTSERLLRQSAASDPKAVLESCESEPIGDGKANKDGCSIKRLNNVQRAAILRILIEHEADYSKDCLEHGFCSRQCACFWARMASHVADQLGWTFAADLLKGRMTSVLIRMSRRPGGDTFTQDLREMVHRWEAIMARHEQRLDYRSPSEKATSASGTASFDMQMWSKSIRNAVETDLVTVNDPFLDDDERVRSLFRLVVIQRRASLDSVPRNNPGLGRTILELAAGLGLRESRALRASVGSLVDDVLDGRDEDQDTGDQEHSTNVADSESTMPPEANTPHGADDPGTEVGKDYSLGHCKRKKDKKKRKAKKTKKSPGKRDSANDGEQEAPPLLHSGEAAPAASIPEESSYALTRKEDAAPTGCDSSVLDDSSPPLFVPLPSPPAGESRGLSEPSTSWSTSPSPGQAGRYHSARSVDLGHSPGMFVTPTPIPTGPRSMSQKRRYSTAVSPNERAWKRQRTDDRCAARTPGMGSPAATQTMTPRGTSPEGSGAEAARSAASAVSSHWRTSRNTRQSTWATPPTSAASSHVGGSQRRRHPQHERGSQDAGRQHLAGRWTGSARPSALPSPSPTRNTHQSPARPRHERAQTMLPASLTMRHQVMEFKQATDEKMQELKRSNERLMQCNEEILRQLRDMSKGGGRVQTPHSEDSDPELPALSRIEADKPGKGMSGQRTHLRW